MIPNLVLKSYNLKTSKLNTHGQLINQYSPLQNTLNTIGQISDCTTNYDQSRINGQIGLDFDLQHPVDMVIQKAYDGGVNLILNDGKNNPKIVNSRFSVQEDNTFKITDHIGFKDTNLYTQDNFKYQTSLLPHVDGILNIQYDGLINDAGELKSGIYIFYFKYADADGNMTEVQGESGLVYCHKGQTNSPSSIRFGLENETTDKAVKFNLSNIDVGYNKVFVYYARVYGNESGRGTEVYKILTPYTVQNGGVCDVVVTGSEKQIQVSVDELQVRFADIGSVETQASFQGMLLQGNVETAEHDWEKLKEISWRIYPTFHNLNQGEVGTLNPEYQDLVSQDDDIKCGYYNTKNLYYRLGYWPEEIYRFGIVYIFNDGSLSPVLDVLGVDYPSWQEKTQKTNLSSMDTFNVVYDTDGNVEYERRRYEPDDGQFTDSLNSKGVTRFPQSEVFRYIEKVLSPTPLYVKFNIDGIPDNYGNTNIAAVWEEHNIKGFFFVRQKRVPNIICQGLVLKQTDKNRGALPCLSANGYILGQSFVDSKKYISHDGYFKVFDVYSPQAFLSPDAILQTPIYNDVFSSGKFHLSPIMQLADPDYKDGDYIFKYGYSNNTSGFTNAMKIINVPDGSTVRTNGVDYFSAMAGNPSEASKTSDLFYEWDHTEPQKLSNSTSIVRGLWGTYAGLEKSDLLQYGQLCNVYKEGRDSEAQWLDNTMRAAKYSNAPYYAICDRQPINPNGDPISCFRGDCFVSLYTHRMFRNFIDESYPTNTEIVDISSWRKNYAVRCTAYSTLGATDASFNNCVKENEGWYLDSSDGVDTSQRLYNQIAEKFVLDVKKLSDVADLDIKEDKLSYKRDDVTHEFIYTNGVWRPTDETKDQDQKPLFSTDIPFGEGTNWQKYTFLQEPDPPKETGFALIDYATTIANINMHEYVERRVRNINRADINAVGLGQWITFPVCSNMNIAMRDLDFKQATEEAVFNEKRAFFPYKRKNKFSKIQDSYSINQALKNTIPTQQYFHIPEWTFFKQEYFNRIYYSIPDSASTNANEWKQILSTNYVDYPKELGTITKIIDNGNNAYIIFEHGIGSIQPNVKDDGSIGLGPIQIIDSTYGSMWKDSIIATDVGIFGVDTVAKAIWKLSGQQLDIISTRTVNKFLIDNIDLSEATKFPYVGHINVKSHYNKNKQDIIFTYYNDIPYILPDESVVGVDDYNRAIDKDGNIIQLDVEKKPLIINPFTYDWDSDKEGYKKLSECNNIYWKKGVQWSICYNLEMGQFVTFYDWIPLESANIDNIFFSFDREQVDTISTTQGVVKDLSNNTNVKTYKVNKHSVDPSFTSITNKYVFQGEISVDISSGDIKSFNSENNEELMGYMFYIQRCKDLASAGNYKLKFIDYYDNEIITDDKQEICITEIVDEQTIKKPIPLNTWVFVCGTAPANTAKLVLGLDKVETAICDFITIPISETKDYTIICPDSNGVFPIDTYGIRDTGNRMLLWKHGQAGLYDNEGKIMPTNWYGKQREFNFEFVVNDSPAQQKIFNNLKMLSNKTAPDKFEFELVGEGYEWFEYKPIVEWINKQVVPEGESENYWWLQVLGQKSGDVEDKYPDFPGLFDRERTIHKLPYLKMKHTDKKGTPERPHYKWDGGTDYWGGKPYDKTNQQYTYNCAEPCLVEDDQLNETRIRTEQLGNDMRKYGRVRGNMQYLEDLWNVEIRPIQITWCYIDNGQLCKKKVTETRHRDKYLKVRVRYSGEDLALIQGIVTMFNESYA